MQGRSELVDGSLDYVLAHGLVGLSLRPLAAALGTSDRMLIYYFGSKQQLVGEVLGRAQQRLALTVTPPSPDVCTLTDLVNHLWTALQGPAAALVTRLYLETCLLALQDPERWQDAPARLRGPWRRPLQSGLIAFGVGPQQAEALSDLILDTLDGLALDRLTTVDPGRVDAAAATFAALLTGALQPPIASAADGNDAAAQQPN